MTCLQSLRRIYELDGDSELSRQCVLAAMREQGLTRHTDVKLAAPRAKELKAAVLAMGIA
jgi:hypothetical protein